MKSNAAALTAAYHAVFDAKDTLVPGSAAFVLAYEALAKMDLLMNHLGVDVPVRYDAPRA